jgi:hypothetical protein
MLEKSKNKQAKGSETLYHQPHIGDGVYRAFQGWESTIQSSDGGFESVPAQGHSQHHRLRGQQADRD